MVSLCRKLRRITQGVPRPIEEEQETSDTIDKDVDCKNIALKETTNTPQSKKLVCVEKNISTTPKSSKAVAVTPTRDTNSPTATSTRSKRKMTPITTTNTKTAKKSDKSTKPPSRPQRGSTPRTPSTPTEAVKRQGRTSRGSVGSPASACSPMALEKKNAKGETPLHVATIKGDITKLKNLLSSGANPNVKDNAGWTPLHEAVNHGFEEITGVLLDSGALVNTPGPDNDTPLHDAVLNNQLECARVLVSQGAAVGQRNAHGYTPLDIAKTEEMKVILKTTKVSSNVVPEHSLSLTPVMKSSHLVILGTGLRRDEKSQLSKCASMLQGTCVNDFTPEVTHVISTTNSDGMCPRTMKYLQAVLSGKWILRFDWAENCLSYGQSVCEEAFEIPGSSTSPDSLAPMKGRLNMEKQLPGLFDGFQFYLSGTFKYPTPSKDELSHLIKLGGGKLLSREPKADNLSDFERTVPYHAKKDSELKDCGHLIVYDPNVKKAKKVRSPHLCSVPATWVMDCIAHFDILDLVQ